MHTLLEHLLVIRSTLQRLLLTPNATLLNILIIGIALSLPVGAYVLLKSVQNLSSQLNGTAQISIFLATGTSADDIESIGNRLKQHTAIGKIEFIPRNVAWKRLQRSTDMADVMGSITQNPLPDAFIIHPNTTAPATLELLRDELKTWSHLEHVQLDSAWVHKLEALLDFARLAVVILAGLLSFGLIAITFNTIRLQILTRREEIEVAKLIGATDGFIRRPFLYFGLTQGLLGGITALLLVSVSLLLLNHHLADLAQLYSSRFSLQALSFADSLALLGFSAYLGWLGAWFSVSQHLWQIEPR